MSVHTTPNEPYCLWKPELAVVCQNKPFISVHLKQTKHRQFECSLILHLSATLCNLFTTLHLLNSQNKWNQGHLNLDKMDNASCGSLSNSRQATGEISGGTCGQSGPRIKNEERILDPCLTRSSLMVWKLPSTVSWRYNEVRHLCIIDYIHYHWLVKWKEIWALKSMNHQKIFGHKWKNIKHFLIVWAWLWAPVISPIINGGLATPLPPPLPFRARALLNACPVQDGTRRQL